MTENKISQNTLFSAVEAGDEIGRAIQLSVLTKTTTDNYCHQVDKHLIEELVQDKQKPREDLLKKPEETENLDPYDFDFDTKSEPIEKVRSPLKCLNKIGQSPSMTTPTTRARSLGVVSSLARRARLLRVYTPLVHKVDSAIRDDEDEYVPRPSRRSRIQATPQSADSTISASSTDVSTPRRSTLRPRKRPWLAEESIPIMALRESLLFYKQEKEEKKKAIPKEAIKKSKQTAVTPKQSSRHESRSSINQRSKRTPKSVVTNANSKKRPRVENDSDNETLGSLAKRLKGETKVSANDGVDSDDELLDLKRLRLKIEKENAKFRDTGSESYGWKLMKQESSAADVSTIEKSLEGLPLDEKVKRLLKRLGESEAQNEKLKVKAAQIDTLQKSNASLEKKVDKSNQLLLKTEESKSKLEELCRTLQKYNKDLRDESNAKIRLLESERQNAVEQLKSTLKDIETSMKEGRERSDRLAEDNKKLAEKLRELGGEYEQRLNDIAKQYEAKDRYIEELKNAKDLEIKLLQAKLDAASCNSHKLNLEKQQLTNKLVEGTVRATDALENEKLLREQVKEYADKYSVLTESLSKSNAAFDKFKKEIDKVNSNMKKMENDAMKWKQKYEEASKNVLVLTMSKKDLEEENALQKKKLNQLEQLCRALSGRGDNNSQAPPAEQSAETSTCSP